MVNSVFLTSQFHVHNTPLRRSLSVATTHNGLSFLCACGDNGGCGRRNSCCGTNTNGLLRHCKLVALRICVAHALIRSACGAKLCSEKWATFGVHASSNIRVDVVFKTEPAATPFVPVLLQFSFS